MKIIRIILIFLFIPGSVMAKKEALYLLAGQSNAVGQGDSLISLVCKPNTAFEFDASANDFIPLKDPAGNPGNSFSRQPPEALPRLLPTG